MNKEKIQFAHLHVHSHYSLLDGLAKIPSLISRAKELNIHAIALTDHGNLYGAIEFYKQAKKEGIKPILGVEAYIAPNGRTNKKPRIDERRYHITLLAKNEIGWKNLLKLVTLSHLEGFYYKPRIDKELIEKFHEGIVCFSGCASGEIPKLIAEGKIEKAEQTALFYKNIFGNDFYIELQPHMKSIEPGLIGLAEKLSISIVATQDIHYVDIGDKTAHEILLAVQTNSKLDDEDRLSLKKYDIHFSSPEEMKERFSHVPEAILNTVRIAEKCSVTLKFGENKLPHFILPDGEQSSFSYLEKLVYERLRLRYEKSTNEIQSRLSNELSVIKKTGFADYFLIVQDLVLWAKNHGIVVGPGRGSAAGSLISYILGITNIDPLKYDLLFERFLNPDRIQVPDIDIDFTDTRRDEVLAYVREKYGEDKVAQIITFGTMAARAAIRDTGRALGLPYGYCDEIAKLIPFNPTQGMKEGWLDECLKNVPELKGLYENDVKAKELIDLAKKLEGTARHASVHACGVVISPSPLSNFVPLQKAPQGENTVITQFDMKSVESLGLLKMDFLGLKNLTIIEQTIRLIKENTGETVDFEKIPLDDKKTFSILQNGDTTGIFQLESSGMRRYLKLLKPTELEDIIAMVSLYRPGPMELIPRYIARKHKREPITYIHPKLKPILEKTYGVGIYQEQMMRIARDLAGFTLAEADTLRKAIGKKIKHLLDEQKEKLIQGMIRNGFDMRTAQTIWDFFPPFARYGFNRCLIGDTRIQNPKTGELVTLAELHKNRGKAETTISISEQNLKEYENKILDIVANGKKPIFNLQTRSGRTITATSNHPFYTPSGWKKLEELKPGNHIATPRCLPEPTSPMRVPHHKLVILGYTLAEGNFCHPYRFYFYSKNENEIADYCRSLSLFENTVCTLNRSKPAVSVYAGRRNLKKPSLAVEWMKSLGMKGKKATEKMFPSFVFNLCNNDLTVLIAKMFQGDGCINNKRDPQIFYATSSQSIARDLQHFLLRLNIVSTIHKKTFKYREGERVGYTISICRYNNIAKFLQAIETHLVGEKQATAKQILASHPIISGMLKNWSARGSKDIVPVSLALPPLRAAALAIIGGFKQAEKQYGITERLFHHDEKKIGFLRETLEMAGKKFNDRTLEKLGSSDIYWDEIASITPNGTAETYDLTMERDHNFVANDIFVHNSHATCYAMISYQTAYLKARHPVEFMTSLLNVSGTDVERINFLVYEAKQHGISVLSPDINQSYERFTADGKNIRFGLSAIKNVGTNIVREIIGNRARGGEFDSLSNFLTRIRHRDLNKKSLESLIKCGAFDSLGIERGQALENIEDLLKFNQAARKQFDSNQSSLFGGSVQLTSLRMKSARPANKKILLSWEKELLGFYLTDHPMNAYAEKIGNETKTIKQAVDTPHSGDRSSLVKIAGVVSGVHKILTKNGSPMLFVTIEDLSGNIETLVFPSELKKHPELWQENKAISAIGRVSWKGGEPKFICDDAKEL